MDLIKELGGPSAVARMTGVTVPSVIGWKGRIPQERCPDIEFGTGGKWTVEQLRPDVRWARVPDRKWPHQKGRPTIDVALPSGEQKPVEPARKPVAENPAARTSDADRRNAEQARMLRRALITRDGPSRERGGRAR
jgi:DNA-binding transcriptional regulator YdaS (Cro superfamily)